MRREAPSPDYPEWFFYPSRSAPPPWVIEFVTVIAGARSDIDSAVVPGVKSDNALAYVRTGLEEMGFVVESGKRRAGKIFRPVLFGDQGTPLVSYEIDGWHDEHKIVLELEAGRGMKGNAFYRDLVRTPLIFDARYLAVGVMREYHHQSGGRPTISRDYRDAKNQLDAIYASGRLAFPFEGILLFGY